jgi:exodeoxyribonuclease-3
MTKIVSWNVNGIQSLVTKDFRGTKCNKTELIKAGKNALQHFLEKENPDILCLQEIRCSNKFNHEAHLTMYGYVYINYSKIKKGYSGTLIASKTPINKIYYDYDYLNELNNQELTNIFNNYPELNNEGRIITAEYNNYFLVNVYVPNCGVTNFNRLDYRVRVWDEMLRFYIKVLQNTKPVIVIGDFNCVHNNIDGYKNNLNIAGATLEEKESFSKMLNECKLRDSYRELYLTESRFSWFSSKSYNYGLRLDYALISANIKLKNANILPYINGSDHVPIVIEIE